MQDQSKQANSVILVVLILIHLTITRSTERFFTFIEQRIPANKNSPPLLFLAFRSCSICNNVLLIALEKGSGWAVLDLVAKSKRKKQNPIIKHSQGVQLSLALHFNFMEHISCSSCDICHFVCISHSNQWTGRKTAWWILTVQSVMPKLCSY